MMLEREQDIPFEDGDTSVVGVGCNAKNTSVHSSTSAIVAPGAIYPNFAKGLTFTKIGLGLKKTTLLIISSATATPESAFGEITSSTFPTSTLANENKIGDVEGTEN